MENKVIRVGVIGLGFGQKVHAPAFARISGCKVVAIAGRDLARAEAAAASLGGAKGFCGWEAMLDAAELDVVSIAAPPGIQAEVVCAAASRGVSVFCEKPAAPDVESAKRMLDAVNKHGVTHAINFIFPEIPAWVDARREVAAMTATGPLRSAALSWCVETYAHRHNLHDGWKRSHKLGGGALNSFVSHVAYYVEWLFGPVARINAQMFPSEGDDDARVEAWLEFESGLYLTLSVALDCPFGTGHRLEVYGPDGAVILENPGSDYVTGFRLRAQSRRTDMTPASPTDFSGVDDGRIWATSQIASRFIHHLRTGGLPTPNLTHGLRVQHLLERFRDSHRAQSWVEVSRGGI